MPRPRNPDALTSHDTSGIGYRHPMAPRTGSNDGVAVAVLAGAAFGALVDGVVLHQVLQWHHVSSGHISDDTLAGVRDNVFIDGVFQLAVIGVLTVAVVALARSVRPPWAVLVGGALI